MFQIINIYRISDSASPRILNSTAQYDRCSGEVQTSCQHRDDLLEQLSIEVKQARDENVDNIIIAGDFNQDIAGD